MERRTVSDGVDDLDAPGTLVRVEAARLRRRSAELEDLELAAHWARLHTSDPRQELRDRGERISPFADRLIEVGGSGSPRVQEHCLA